MKHLFIINPAAGQRESTENLEKQIRALPVDWEIVYTANPGDAVRFAANMVEEDSPEAEKAGVNMEIFRAFAEGFLSKTANSLTQPEIDTLALSCLALTCELATRFLADYLAGDVYFKTNYAEHNLVRTRCQIALAKDMLQKLPQMEKIIGDCVGKV